MKKLIAIAVLPIFALGVMLGTNGAVGQGEESAAMTSKHLKIAGGVYKEFNWFRRAKWATGYIANGDIVINSQIVGFWDPSVFTKKEMLELLYEDLTSGKVRMAFPLQSGKGYVPVDVGVLKDAGIFSATNIMAAEHDKVSVDAFVLIPQVLSAIPFETKSEFVAWATAAMPTWQNVRIISSEESLYGVAPNGKYISWDPSQTVLVASER